VIHRWAADVVLVIAAVGWLANIVLSVMVEAYDQSEAVNAVVLAVMGGVFALKRANGNGSNGQPKDKS
jgi:hypothetical protein